MEHEPHMSDIFDLSTMNQQPSSPTIPALFNIFDNDHDEFSNDSNNHILDFIENKTCMSHILHSSTINQTASLTPHSTHCNELDDDVDEFDWMAMVTQLQINDNIVIACLVADKQKIDRRKLFRKPKNTGSLPD